MGHGAIRGNGRGHRGANYFSVKATTGSLQNRIKGLTDVEKVSLGRNIIKNLACIYMDHVSVGNEF